MLTVEKPKSLTFGYVPVPNCQPLKVSLLHLDNNTFNMSGSIRHANLQMGHVKYLVREPLPKDHRSWAILKKEEDKLLSDTTLFSLEKENASRSTSRPLPTGTPSGPPRRSGGNRWPLTRPSGFASSARGRQRGPGRTRTLRSRADPAPSLRRRS